MHTNVRFSCSSQTSKGRTNVLATPGSGKLLDSVTSIFGAKLKDSLIEVHHEIESGFSLDGMISKAVQGCGLSSTDRQFLFVNKRPIDFPKLQKVINEVYRSFSMHQYPVFILNISLPSDEYDINVTPDKRQVMIHREKHIVESVKEQLQAVFEPSRYTLPVSAPARDASGRSQDATALDRALAPEAGAADADQSQPIALSQNASGASAASDEAEGDVERPSATPCEAEGDDFEPCSLDEDASRPTASATLAAAGAAKAAAKSAAPVKTGAATGSKGKAREEQPRISAFLDGGRARKQPRASEGGEDEEDAGAGAGRPRRRRREEQEREAGSGDEWGDGEWTF